MADRVRSNAGCRSSLLLGGIAALFLLTGLAGAQQWVIEVVDQGSVGKWTSIAVGGDGRPHISYYDEGNENLKYAHHDGSVWHVETVDATGEVGRYTSIALETVGYPHISYCEWGNVIFDPPYIVEGPVALRHAYWDGSTWHIQSPGRGGGGYTSIGIDWMDQVHIGDQIWVGTPQHQVVPQAVRYSHWDGNSWLTETVESGPPVGYYTSLAVDSNLQPHMSYSGGQGLRYAYRDASGWHIGTVDVGGAHCSVALDAAGHTHVSYYDPGSQELKYAFNDGSGWQIQTVDGDGDVGQYSSIALDGSGYPHISYFEASPSQDLKYARWDGSAWNCETVDSEWWDTGQYSSLALDGAGNPHISFYDATYGDLRYAYRLALYPPTASIDNISPNPAYQGQDIVYFEGSAWDNDENGSSITAYEWLSDLDGVLAQAEDFSLPAADLSLGTHAITFRVWDDEGDWAEDYATLEILTLDLPPGAVTNLMAYDTPNDQGGSISLAWTKSPDDGGGENDVVGYLILRSEQGDPTYTQVDSLAPGTESYADATVTDLVIYSYIVRTVDAGANTADSDPVSAAAADNIAPAPPTDLSAMNIGQHGWALLSWELSVDDTLGGVDDVVCYLIQRSTTSGSDHVPIDSVLADLDNYLDQTTVPGTRYFYVVAASDGQNVSDDSNEAEVWVTEAGDPNGVRLPQHVVLALAGANPVRQTLSVTYGLPAPAMVRLALKNLRGEAVAVLDEGHRQAGFHTVSWALTDVPHRLQGLYMLTFEAGEARLARRVILVQ